MKISQTRILLTGATGGLGRALAAALVAQGAQLLLCGRDAGRLARLCDELGGAHRAVTADLTTEEGVRESVRAAAEFGVDVLVNNAGIGDYGLFAERSWGRIESVVHTDLLAPMRLTHALLPQLLPRPVAAVVNVGSVFGSLPFAGFTAYSASKAGLRAFSQALRREVADTGLKVFYFAPRAIDTAMNPEPVRRLNAALGTVQDPPALVAARIVQALIADRYEVHSGFPERLFCWINGVCPHWIDRGVAGKLAAIKRFAKESQT